MKKLGPEYNPAEIEKGIYERWEEKGYFAPRYREDRKNFSIVIPPPNVTGVLHMGHALNNTLQDILVRWRRMAGDNVLWVPGTDHAGIATQYVVEKELAKEGLTKEDLGRDKFLERVWRWKEESGGIILEQLKRLGCSCSWDHVCFTMDEKLSLAVRETFIRLYNEGLIYRDLYLINWCPRCRTALSDLESPSKEVQGNMYYIKYPLEDSDEYLTIATTRPETMLGDTAVAVHPDDERYRHLIGKNAILPLVGRKLPIIQDTYVDPKFGTGCLKVTPAHDLNDFRIGLRHNLDRINILTEDGRINEKGGKYAGLTVKEARKAVIEDLKKEGLLVKTEPYMHSVPHCFRCGTMVEPYLSSQWFIKTKPLAEPAAEAVREGKTVIVPKQYENWYLEWMDNIMDWCISRQIWWGHRIPAWYCNNCDETHVGHGAPKKCKKCGGESFREETDVLDTWYSSALWPFSTMGWPDETKDLKWFYPTSVLVTGFDIINFWVARMMMMGIHFMGDVPFRYVYIHGLIRDAMRRKISKTLGNVIDPLDLMGKYGTDAMRFTLAAMCVQGRDIALRDEVLLGYKHFMNKIWNASKLVLAQLEGIDTEGFQVASAVSDMADVWMIDGINKIIRDTTKALEEFRFNDYALGLYHFFWHQFCDWYLEVKKKDFYGGDAEKRKKAAYLCGIFLEILLRLLHPVIPFITEYIWQRLPWAGKDRSIMVEDWPSEIEFARDEEAVKRFEIIRSIVTAVRNMKSELGVPLTKKGRLIIRCDEEGRIEAVNSREEEEIISMLAHVSPIIYNEDPQTKIFSSAVAKGMEIIMPLEELINIEAEKERLKKELAKARAEADKFRARLASKDFIQKAPAEVVEKARATLSELEDKESRLEKNLARLEGRQPQ